MVLCFSVNFFEILPNQDFIELPFIPTEKVSKRTLLLSGLAPGGVWKWRDRCSLTCRLSKKSGLKELGLELFPFVMVTNLRKYELFTPQNNLELLDWIFVEKLRGYFWLTFAIFEVFNISQQFETFGFFGFTENQMPTSQERQPTANIWPNFCFWRPHGQWCHFRTKLDIFWMKGWPD